MATMPTRKLYVYVDETGQDTTGSLFLVAVVFVDGVDRLEVEDSIRAVERQSRKGEWKWAYTSVPRRQAYLRALVPLFPRVQPIAYRRYRAGTDYLERTAETILAAITSRQLLPETQLTIVIDGLGGQERQTVSRYFRQHRLPFARKVRGGRDESTPFIRPADAMAGFLRHLHEKRPYTDSLWKELEQFVQDV